MKEQNTNSALQVRPVDSGAQDILPAGRADDYYTDTGRKQGASGINWRHIIAFLVRRRKLIISIFALVILATVVLTATARKVYRAEAQLLVKAEGRNSMGRLAESLPAITSMLQFTETDSQETQVQILKSSSIQKLAVKRLTEQQQDALKKFRSTSVTPIRGTEVIQIAISSPSADASVAMVNAICQTFLEQGQEDNSQLYKGTAQYVERQLKDVEKNLTQVSQKLMRFKQTHNIVDLGIEGQKRIEQLSLITAQLQQAQTEKQAGDAQVARLQSNLRSLAPMVESSSTSVASPVVQQLKQQLTQYEVQRLSLLQEFTPQSPEYKALEEQISALKKRLNQEAATVVGTTSRSSNPVYEQVLRDISTAQAQAWANESRSGALTREVARLQTSLKQLPARQYELGQLEMRERTLQAVYQSLADKYETLRISEQAPFTNAKVLSGAERATQVSPRWTRNLPLGFVVGLLLAVGIAALLEFWDDRIYSEEDVQDATGLPVLAQVPMVKAEDGEVRTRILPDQKTSLLLESYRMLRTHISFASISAPIRSIVLTSSQPHEGKSTAAINLATVLALDGKKVILVDCDLRNPSVHRNLDLHNQVGFTSILAGESTLEDSLQDTDVPNLQILSAGPMPPNPPEVLNSGPARTLLETLRDRADILVIDSPPSLIMSDASILAGTADATIFVVSSNEAGKREVARSVESLRISGTRMLGVILNKIDLEMGGYYGYYSYYGYYRRYGYKYEGYGLGNGTSDSSADEEDEKHELKPKAG